MSEKWSEGIDPEPVAEEADAPAPMAEDVDAPATMEIHLRWTHALLGLLAIAGVTAALALGIWLGRSRSASTVVQARPALPGQPQVIPLRPAQPQVIPLQPGSAPRAPATSSQPRSSAGVTTSIGRTPNVGDPAPDFTLKTLDGEKVSLSDFKGRPVLINFWATWCPPCRFEMPAIEKAWQQYKDDGFVVLGVNVEEPISVVQRFVENFGLSFPVLLDYKGNVSDMYRLRAFPTSYFVGRDGKIVIAHRGMMTEQVLQRYMQRVMATQAE